MKPKITQWMKRIQNTQAEEIDCSTCLDLVSEYVDLELSLQRPEQRLPLVKQHLDQCGVCFDEYRILRELARQEQAGESPSIDELSERIKRPPE